MNQIINADMRRYMSSKTGHGHQTYTVDPCQYDSNLNIATKNTLWIYPSIQTEKTPMQPESVRKYPGSSYPPLYSTNLTMRIHVSKSNMVETT
jgi:hypothetical protein